jgi:hypothetical protein
MAISPGVTVQNPDHGSLSIDLPNRWYRPETASPSSLRCIQIEEEAMKELRRVYKNVKLVRQVDIQWSTGFSFGETFLWIWREREREREREVFSFQRKIDLS